MIIEKGKFYLQETNGYITDVVEYNPNIEGYNLFEIDKLPQDIMNGCYRIENNKLVLDKIKYAEFVAEQERLLKEFQEVIEDEII
jgi:hypothetical protein